MITKFYRVKRESKFYKDQWYFAEMVIRQNKRFKTIANEHGIEAKQIFATCEQVGIVPTDKDRQNFEQQLCKTKKDGVRMFKKQSPINKKWT